MERARKPLNGKFKMSVLFLFLILTSSALGYKQIVFKVFRNHGFLNNSTIFRTVPDSSLIKCSAYCLEDIRCYAALFNRNDAICSMSKTCEPEIVSAVGSDVIQNCPVDCSKLPSGLHSGVYQIYPIVEGVPYETEVFCDMDNGAWTVIQRRTGFAVSFNRTYDEYKKGFGDKQYDHWLGNELLHHMLSNRKYRVRIDLEDMAGNNAHAEYDSFFVGNETSEYILNISGFSGTAGDSITNALCDGHIPNPNHVLNGVKFSAPDRDNDNCDCKCSTKSGWWFNWCACGNLNNLEWTTMSRSSLKSAVMKIRA